MNRFYLFSRIWALSAVALLVVTWKLWTPQTEFPQIPFFEILIHTPGWLDWSALLIAGLSLLFCAVQIPRDTTPRVNWFRVANLTFAFAIALLISLDQNRLQPWAYHFAVIGLLIGLANPPTAARLIRWIAISIYVFSAISKFDYQFMHTVGDQMLSTLLGFVGVETAAWPQKVTRALVILLPLGELLVGTGLAIPQFRRIAVVAAAGLHVALLLMLGPWGLDHRPGVLIWNAFFILQALILFWPGTSFDKEIVEENVETLDQAPLTNDSPKPTHNLNGLALLLTISVLCFPLTQWIGLCDHWPGWQVYSPSSSRAQLLGQKSVSEWSLNELGVPVYPQSRFQLAVAMAVVEKANKNQTNGPSRNRGFQIELRHQSNRFTGRRRTETLTGVDQFKMKTSRFWLNTRARKIWFD